MVKVKENPSRSHVEASKIKLTCDFYISRCSEKSLSADEKRFSVEDFVIRDVM